MAALTPNVSGVYLLPITLTSNSTIVPYGAVDGQQLLLEVTQDSTGSRTLTSTQIPNLVAPTTTANATSYQLFVYKASLNTWIGWDALLA